MVQNYFPSLSESSWITSPSKIADHLFSHFYEADYSQDEIYVGKVSSLAWLVANFSKDYDRLTNEIENTLRIYFGRYFKNVDCECTWQPDKNNSSLIVTTLYLTFSDDEGNSYNLNKIIQTSGNKIIAVLDSNNFGI